MWIMGNIYMGGINMEIRIPTLKELIGPLYEEPITYDGLIHSVFLGVYFSKERGRRVDLYFRYYSDSRSYIGIKHDNNAHCYVGKRLNWEKRERKQDHMEGIRRSERKGLIVYDKVLEKYIVTEKGKGKCL